MFAGDILYLKNHVFHIKRTEAVLLTDPDYRGSFSNRGFAVDPHGKEWIILSNGIHYSHPEEVDPSVPTVMVRMWTMFNAPFRLGGTTEPKGCDIPAGEKVDLGKGFEGYLIRTPQGRQLVVEMTSGGIVGSNLKQVRDDIERSDVSYMLAQVEDARIMALGMRVITPEEFWAAYEPE